MLAPDLVRSTTSSAAHRRVLILFVCSIAAFISQLDTSVLNVALPSIQRSFRSSVGGLQWITDAYVLVLCCLALLCGSLADRYGRRRMFRMGLSIFLVGSVLCSLAPNIGFLVFARAFQAVGGSMLNANAVAIITSVFVEQRDRARALGFWSSVSGISLAAGPIIGGALVETLGWRSIFWLNVPIVIAVLLLSRRHIPESKSEHRRAFDVPGQLIVMGVLFAFTFAIIEGPVYGWSSVRIVTIFTTGAIGLAAFVTIELKRRSPLLEMHLFKSPPFVAAGVVAILTFITLSGFLFTNSIYFQDVRGGSALRAGVLLLPSMAAFALMAPASGRIIGHFGVRPSLVGGGLLLAGGSALLTHATSTTSFATLQVGEILVGLGFGATIPPITYAAMAGMPRAQAGVASAMTGMFRSIGTTLGVAVTGSLIATSYFANFARVLANAAIPASDRALLNASGIGAANIAAHAAAPSTRSITPALRSALANANHVTWWIAFGAGLTVALFAAATTGPAGRAIASRVLVDE